MPFTFAHPVLIIPLRKYAPRFVSLTGLIVGSMVPDFEYFLRMKIKSSISHTPLGLLLFDLPLGILLAYLVHIPVKRSVIDALPGSWRQRLQGVAGLNWSKHWQQYYLLIIISIFIGSVSHLVWDAFTHESGYFVRTFAPLQTSVDIYGHIFPVYKLLQHASTGIGITILSILFLRMPKEPEQAPRHSSNFLPAIILLAILIFVLRWGAAGFFLKTGDCIVSMIAAAMFSVVFISGLKYLSGAGSKNKQ
jgi:hypothetical protein